MGRMLDALAETRPATGIYRLADASTCSGAISLDDRDLGLNNQLASRLARRCVPPT